MDSTFRRPIVDILSERWTASIPFGGNYRNGQSPEIRPNLFTHSSGRFVLTLIYNSRYLRYAYTDIDRNEFTNVEFDAGEGRSILGASAMELPDGAVGIITIHQYQTTYYLRYRIVTVEGVNINSGAIADWSTSVLTSEPAVIALLNGSFVMVYTKATLVSGAYVHAIKRRTSSDFITWSAETDIVISGVGSGRIRNPYLVQESGWDVLLFFDHVDDITDAGEEKKNSYYAVSSTSGATWSEAVRITDYDTFSEGGGHPVFVEKYTGSGILAYTEQKNVLSFNTTSVGYCGPNDIQTVSTVVFDDVNRKLYYVCRWTNAGVKRLFAVIRADVDTWAIERCWNYVTVPALNQYFSDNHCWSIANQGTGHLVGAGHSNDVIAVVDGEADAIRLFAFSAKVDYGIPANISGYEKNYSAETICRVVLDNVNQKLWVAFDYGSGNYSYYFQIGYIDLAQQVGPYSFNTIYKDRIYEYGAPVMKGRVQSILVDQEHDSVIVSYICTSFYNWHDIRAFIISISSGGISKLLRKSEMAALPLNGFMHRRGLWFDGTSLYAGIVYSDAFEEQDRRGLCEINLQSGGVFYWKPSWGTYDNYGLRSIVAAGPNHLLMSSNYGITRFDLTNKTWELYDSTSVPGFNPFAWPAVDGDIYDIAYDPTNELIFTGWGEIAQGIPFFGGVTAFSSYGAFRQTQYKFAVKDGTWTFSQPVALVMGFSDYDMVLTADPSDSSLYGFWTRQAGAQYFAMWDREDVGLNLREFLVSDVPIVRTESIDSSPGSLTFAVSHGHLFDPHNHNSLLAPKLGKRRKITLLFGEYIQGDIDMTYAAQGVYLITQQRMEYGRGKYPIMHITAEDRRVLFEHAMVRATEAFSAPPENVVKHILKAWGNLVDADFDNFVFDYLPADTLYYQWIDTDLQEIIDQIYNRYGCFFRFDAYGRVSSGSLNPAKAIAHTYTDTTKMVRFGPDDMYSDYTNRVTIEAQEQGHLEVVFGEEPVGSLNGTVGWYGFKNDYRVWYSEDKSRRCQSPRLEVIESATGIIFRLAGDIRESLIDDDPQQLSCIIEVSAPSLIPVLISGIALYIAGSLVGDVVVGFGAGMTVPVGRLIEAAGLTIAFATLGSIGNFQYKIHARPVGKIQRMVQATANDVPHQVDIGAVIEKKFFDPLCYTVGHCAQVAEYELSIARMQRGRVSLQKTADLRDEPGDIIQVVHPYTGLSLKLLITRLTRTLKRPKNASDRDGYFLDDIEGWVIP